MSNIKDDEPFLSRWARMKRDAARPSPKSADDAAASGADVAAKDAETEPTDDTATVAEAATGPAQDPIDLAKLPRLEDLTAETDITAFLDARVPAALRNAALGRMWTLDPTIRDFIEVAENQWNWNVPGGAPFYELMEPGSGGGALVADASSAISRALGVPEPSAVQQNLFAENEKQLQQGIGETIDPDRAAPQYDAPTDTVNEAAPEPMHRIDTAIIATSDAVDVAPQQDELPATADEAAQRRRHGGALPA